MRSRYLMTVSVLVVVMILIGGGVVLAGYGPFDLWSSRNAETESVGGQGQVEGTVRNFDAETRRLSVARGILGLSSSVVAVTAETRVNVAGKIGAFGDLREGLPLRVCYEVRPDGRWARSIEVPPSGTPCRAADLATPDPPAAPPAEMPGVQPVPGASVAPSAAVRPGPPSTPPARAVATPPTPSARVVTPSSPSSAAAAPSRPRSAEPVRTAPAPARSGEDYGAVIDWVLRQ